MLAAIAVGFAAADTYVVVLALPDMMASVGLNIDELQRAAPIVSGFLLGYIAMLPLMGRIADLRGRVPVLVGSLRRLLGRLAGHGGVVRPGQHGDRPVPAGRRRRRAGAGDARAGRRHLGRRAARPAARAWSAPCRSSAACLGPLYGAVVLASAELAHDLLDQPGRRAWCWRRAPAALAGRARSPARRSPAAARPDLLGAVLGVRRRWSRWRS